MSTVSTQDNVEAQLAGPKHDTMSRTYPRANRLWRQLTTRFRSLGFGRRHPQVFHLPPDPVLDVPGLPGDVPKDIPSVLSTISRVMDETGIRWCMVGDMLLAHYRVPRITRCIEICVPVEELDQVQEAFSKQTGFCFPFRSETLHVVQYPRFKVRSMNRYICLIPRSYYGLGSEAFDGILHIPQLGFPLLPLPHYVQSLANIAGRPGTNNDSFIIQIESLIDGMDIDEEWCNTYLSGSEQQLVRSMSTQKAKQERMSSHPKCEDNLTTYIHNDIEREEVLGVVGRVTKYHDRVQIETQGSTPNPDANNAPFEAMSPPVTIDHSALSVQLMSDLHLELSFRNPKGDSESVPGYEAFDCTPSSPILALLGDIGLAAQDGLFDFLQRQLFKYEKILFVMGNHEYYQNSPDEAKARMILFADQMQKKRSSDNSQGEFILLDQTRYDLTEDVTILGCTLWSHIPSTAAEVVGKRLKDFRRIQQWSVESHNAAHAADAAWLDRECAKIKAEEPGRRVVVFTHHAPTIRGSSAPAHLNSSANSAFATDMTVRSCWGYPVSLWAFGHTHFNCDFVQGDVRVVSNQRGYEGVEAFRTGFSDHFVLRL